MIMACYYLSFLVIISILSLLSHMRVCASWPCRTRMQVLPTLMRVPITIAIRIMGYRRPSSETLCNHERRKGRAKKTPHATPLPRPGHMSQLCSVAQAIQKR
jgi:hypothetical protein